jgi:hypothetical protein
LNDALPGAMQRNRYMLTLDEPATLDITAHGTGETTADSLALAPFDSVLFLYDAQGRLLFWNDEDTHADDWIADSSADAGIDALPLEAGTYFIEVGGFIDLIAGPYELTVAAIQSAAAQKDTARCGLGISRFVLGDTTPSSTANPRCVGQGGMQEGGSNL